MLPPRFIELLASALRAGSTHDRSRRATRASPATSLPDARPTLGRSRPSRHGAARAAKGNERPENGRRGQGQDGYRAIGYGRWGSCSTRAGNRSATLGGCLVAADSSARSSSFPAAARRTSPARSRWSSRHTAGTSRSSRARGPTSRSSATPRASTPASTSIPCPSTRRSPRPTRSTRRRGPRRCTRPTRTVPAPRTGCSPRSTTTPTSVR